MKKPKEERGGEDGGNQQEKTEINKNYQKKKIKTETSKIEGEKKTRKKENFKHPKIYFKIILNNRKKKQEKFLLNTKNGN